jgi:hypothetical protein
MFLVSGLKLGPNEAQKSLNYRPDGLLEQAVHFGGPIAIAL